MTTANSIYNNLGGLQLPLDVADFSGTLAPLDPARATLTALFAAAINAELTEAWQSVVGRSTAPAITGLGASHRLYNTTPVQSTLELEPNPIIMRELKKSMPLLCVHRSGTGTYDSHTLNADKLTQAWNVHYILGELDTGELRKVGDACVAAAKIIRMTIRKRGHLAYQAGALQFFPGVGDLCSVELKSHEGPGQAKFAGDEDGPMFYAISMALETVEILSDNLDVYPPFEGVMYEVGGGDGNTIFPGLIYADSAVPLQIG